MKKALLLMCLLLSACATVPKQPEPLGVDNSLRMAYLASHEQWAFNGRLAYSHLGNGGSAKAQWQQNKRTTNLTLTSALNIGTIKLMISEDKAQLISNNGVRREGSPEALMQEMLNAPIPYKIMASGLRADWSGHSNALIIWRDGLPYQVDIDGWRWQYQEWIQEPAVLPKKIELSQGQTRLRIVIDQWQEVVSE